ncbi:flagellar biosynthetic protein FliO [Roseospira visakhapatnamensis]|uniref:Flagellar protein FliO/FliZ n=1 Tax=Roseospira visakhapatnamensis TaxID=390880 RepID=A0A7W6RDP1_9PROT|nr:flagellar biosynthetic protein FliO [Roseospira visakhapatnamensis]MBB4266430.1 flagellar protein FliO/FliZ [Roseospira visakhapatnamensis]
MDIDSYIRLVLSLVLVIGLILLLAVGLRRWGARLGVPAAAGGRARRLRVVEATVVDTRRRLVLVRRDETEHLLLVGGLNDVVVEQDIPVPPDTDPPAEPLAPGSFRSVLKRRGGTAKDGAAGDETRR